MKKANQDKIKALIFALIATVLFIGGIPAIILGAGGRSPVVMWVGIVLVVLNFYVMPIAWIQYGEKGRLVRLVSAITQEYVMKTEDLSAHLSRTADEIKADIRLCVEKGYLKGYVFDGTELRINSNRNPVYEMIPVICPNCGAKFAYKRTEQPVCPYCGLLIKEEKKK